jgi:methyl-accepting chemotaxis protein
VVASEVRTLAQRSATAARDIKNLITHSAEQIQSGTDLADQAGAAMLQMVESVRRVADIVIDIADASREQSHGIAQVNGAIAHMDEVTQRNAALVEQSAAATEAMQAEADQLLGMVGVFRLAQQGQLARAPGAERLPMPRGHAQRAERYGQ